MEVIVKCKCVLCTLYSTVPESGGLLINIVCMAMMLGPVKHSTYLRICAKKVDVNHNVFKLYLCSFYWFQLNYDVTIFLVTHQQNSLKVVRDHKV